MNQRGSGGRGIDRRSSDRTTVDISAAAEFEDGTSLSCRIRDLSAGGARLEIEGRLGHPDTFDRFDRFVLRIPSHDSGRTVRVAWRYMTELGVAFVQPGEGD